MINNTIIESVDLNNISNNELLQVAEVEKDMWAYGIWEYVKCNNCSKIYSKNDIFWYLADDIKKESVTRLEEILAFDSIKCSICSSDTSFIYDVETNKQEIKKRLFQSKASFLTVLRDTKNNDIHGFMDWYISDFETIYEREFKPHYKQVWINKIKEAFEYELGSNIPKELFTISSIWTDEKYKSLSNFLNLIRSFVINIPENYNTNLWLVEFDTWSNIHSIYHVIWFKKITLDSLSKSLIADSSDNYNSDLYFLPNMIKESREKYSQPIREFIKLHWKKMREVLIN